MQQQITSTWSAADMPAADALWHSSSVGPEKVFHTVKPDTDRSDPDIPTVLKGMWYKCN